MNALLYFPCNLGPWEGTNIIMSCNKTTKKLLVKYAVACSADSSYVCSRFTVQSTTRKCSCCAICSGQVGPSVSGCCRRNISGQTRCCNREPSVNAKPSSVFSCPCCGWTRSREDVFMASACGHEFCRDCAREVILSAARWVANTAGLA